VGCYGNPDLLTPNIDRLSESGIRFSQAITGGSWTQAAFPVLLTSSKASKFGGCLGPLADGRPTPIARLAEHGYSTGGFSTSPLLSREYAYDRGFDHFEDLQPGETDPFLRKVKGGHFLLKSSLTHTFAGLFGLQTRPAKIYVSAEDLTKHLCRWIDQANKPFFAWAHYMDVHWPYHREEKLTRPGEIAQAWRDVTHLHQANWNGASISPEQRDHYIRLYEQAVAYTDSQIGMLVDFLEAEGRLDDTIIIILSDHGEEFLEHGRWGHWENNLHDEVLKVPLIIYLPGYPGSRFIEGQVRTIDLMPTILDLCGCPPEEGMEGTSLASLWDGRRTAYDGSVSISEMWRDTWHIIAVRTERHKYIWDSRKPEQAQLFDLQADPGENQDIRDRFPGLVDELHRHVDDVLLEMDQTRPEVALAEPDLDEKMKARLRDLGYIE
jgi:arylsulfatase A-like enzyme